jgi:hypothetical protein
VEKAVRARVGVPPSTIRSRSGARPAAIIALEERLQGSLGTQVHIRYGPKHSGKISIAFASLDDLERIFNELM